MNTPRIVVSLDGAIASGKSSVLEFISKRYSDNVTVIPEAVSVWRNVGTFNLLAAALGRFASMTQIITFQFVALCTSLFEPYKVKDMKPILITERNALSQKEVFWKQLCAQNKLSAPAYAALNNALDSFPDPKKLLTPHAFIFLTASPSTLYDRCLQRGHIEESEYDLKFFQQHHAAYQEFIFSTIPEQYSSSVVYVIDTTFLNKSQVTLEVSNIIEKFIQINKVEEIVID